MPSQRTYPVPLFISYGPPKNVLSTTSSFYMASRRTYPVPHFISYGQPKNIAVTFSDCSRCHAHKITVHLHHDVGVHPHHLHVQYPAFHTTGCPPCSAITPQPLRVTQLLLPAYRRFARRGTREAKPGSVYPSRTVFCLSQLTSIFWLVIPSSKYKQKHTLNRLNHQSLTINTRSSGQVRQFSARFLPLEKEQGHQTQ